MQSLPSFAATCRACNDAVANEGHWQIRYLDRFGSSSSQPPTTTNVEVSSSWLTQYKSMQHIWSMYSQQVEHRQQWPPPPTQQEEEGGVCIKKCCKRLCIFLHILMIPFTAIFNVVFNIWLEPDIGLFLLISFDVIVLILGLWYVIRVDGQVRSILHM
jgi:hypothetical protein